MMIPKALLPIALTFALLAEPALFPKAQAAPNCDVVGSVGNDCVFLRLLKIQGIIVLDQDATIAEGQRFCDYLREGISEGEIVQALLRDNATITGKQAIFYVSLAKNTYCPWG
jgi:hypothetical protein